MKLLQESLTRLDNRLGGHETNALVCKQLIILRTNKVLLLVRIEANDPSSLSISSLERLQGVQRPGVSYLLIECESTAIRVGAILSCDEERVKELESFGCHKILTEDKTIWHTHLEEEKRVHVCVTCLISEYSNIVHLLGLYGDY